MNEVRPDVAAEIATLLAARGWTVRKLRDQGFGATAATALLGKAKTLPSLSTVDAALRLIGRRLWHGRPPKPRRP